MTFNLDFARVLGWNIPLADHKAAIADAWQEGLVDGEKAARERIKNILSSEQAKGCEGLALHLAFETDASVEAARSLLGKVEGRRDNLPSVRKQNSKPTAADIGLSRKEIHEARQIRDAEACDPLALGGPMLRGDIDGISSSLTETIAKVWANRKKGGQ